MPEKLLSIRAILACRLRGGRRVWHAVILLLFGTLTPAYAEEGNLELQVKAAFIYKFAQYVEWPAASFTKADAPLLIGEIGSGEMSEELTRITAGYTVNGHPIQVKRLENNTVPEGIHILFISKKADLHLKDILTLTRNLPTLTITESQKGLELGSMVNFVIDEQRVRFEIALGTAERSGLKLSSRLLAVAKQVH